MPLGHSRVAVPPHANRGDPLCSPRQGGHRPPLLRYPGRLLRLLRDAGVAVPLVSWELVKDVGKSWCAAAAAGGSGVTSTASVNPAEFLGFTRYVSSDSTPYSHALSARSPASARAVA